MLKLISDFKKNPLFFLNSFDVCFDFGTSFTSIAIKNKGVVLHEPSYIGINLTTKESLFFGNEAKNILGKTPNFIKIIRPIVHGIISDFDAQVNLIEHFFNKSVKIYLNSYKILKPPLKAVVAVPNLATEIEKKASEEVLLKIGFSDVLLVEKSIANASYIKNDVFSHQPILIVDMGGGLIEAAIVSGGGIINCKTIKTAGDTFNQTIANYIYLKYGVVLGENTCENIKINLLNFNKENKTLTVRGKSLANSLPKSLRINSLEIIEALISNFNQIVDLIKELLEISPPEVVNEIYNQGIFLCGGLAYIPGIDNFIASETKIPVKIIPHPQETTIKGLLKIFNQPENLNKLSLPKI
ncbi:MAG: rod shape-determining protein [Patescibacteria group bacterium]|nr:rod shape-determining protein [Patescibacteria group bacterium]